MLSGGIGITPLRSMMQYATDKKLSCKITLFYSNKAVQDIAFLEELMDIEQKNPLFKPVLTITRPEESQEEWKGAVGRIDEKLVSGTLGGLKNHTFFICGPPSMVTAMAQLLEALKVPKEKICTELFSGYK